MDVMASATVEHGTLKIHHRAEFVRSLRALRDGPVTVLVKRKRATRSLAQNRLYWSCYVHVLADHTGYTDDEIHEILKAKFLPKTVALQDGNGEVVAEFVIGGSTVKLNKLEFGDYLRNIKLWAFEKLDVEIPEPHDD